MDIYILDSLAISSSLINISPDGLAVSKFFLSFLLVYSLEDSLTEATCEYENINKIWLTLTVCRDSHHLMIAGSFMHSLASMPTSVHTADVKLNAYIFITSIHAISFAPESILPGRLYTRRLF